MPPHADTLTGFIGVNLRRDRLSLADGECARAINADLHTFPGVLRPRRGTIPLATAGGSVVSRLLRQSGARYALSATAWYRNEVAIVTGLVPYNGQAVGFRGVDDPTTWVFLANSAAMRKDDGVNVRNWGAAAPLTAAVLTAGAPGGLIGNYSLRYTYLRRVGDAVAYESNPSPASNTVGVTNQVIAAAAIADSPDPQITHKRLYRTVNSGSDWLFEADIAQGVTTATLSVADTALGTTVEEDNDQPPFCGWGAEFQNHIFLAIDAANPHYLWYSKRFRPESVPAANFLEVGYPGDPIQGGARLVGLLGLYTRDTKYRIVGNATSGFVAIEALSSRGTPAGHATIASDQGAIFVARDGLFLTNFQSADVALSTAIEPLFYGETVNDYAPIDWSRAREMALGSYKQRYYFSYPTIGGGAMMAVYSRETQQWYHYSIAPTAMYTDETSDVLWGGGDGGAIVAIDSPQASTEAVTTTATFADRGGPSSFLRKRFGYLRIDAEAGSQPVTVQLWVDGVLRHTIRVTGSRRRQLYRLPDGVLGYVGRVTVTLTAPSQAVYSVVLINEPLGAF